MIARRYETGKQLSPHGLRLVCNVLVRGNSMSEDMANAHLIFAAPEMYQALTLACAAVADVTHCGGDDCTDCEVGTALRKARGEA